MLILFYRHALRACLFLPLSLSLINTVACQAVEQRQQNTSLFGTPEAAITAAIEDELDMPVTLQVETTNKMDQWAFLTGLPLTSEGTRIDYSKTRYAEDIAEGFFDDGFVALAVFDKTRNGWELIALSLGATDAPFVGWPEQFGVPKKLIFPQE